MVGGVKIGGGAPVAVQSMTNTDTRDAIATLTQISRLAGAGCEIVRVAVPDEAAAKALQAICLSSPLPVIADIHFDYKLALASIEAGVHGLRINPGNIGSKHAVDAVSKAAHERNIPIRIGVNSGSVEKEILRRFGGPTPEAMVESALGHVHLLEERNFYNLKISIKSSSVPDTIAAYRLLSKKCDYPLHIGITEAGTLLRGAVKSAVGLGILLAEGLGDTLRVSLTHDPIREVDVAWQILRSLSLRRRGPEIISCPTCGRTEIDLISLATQVEERLAGVRDVFTLAVMGCVVNGPGEAKEADLGIAGGRGKGVIFRKGRMVRSVSGGTPELLEALLQELHLFLRERGGQSEVE
jgi:(E)-4-hydroxy-3-methylbut-2-enyl-diphosphate synthase